jgi:selenocysteine lyase/cysteine desulfurase
MHCPPGYGARPVNTGWFAGFGELEGGGAAGRVAYREDGYRFAGATFDPSALYRFNAVMDLWGGLGVGVADIHAHVRSLQDAFLEVTDELALAALPAEALVPGRAAPERGHFLTFQTPDAAQMQQRLADHRVITDHRGDRLRFGFGIYHDRTDVEALGQRLARLFT